MRYCVLLAKLVHAASALSSSLSSNTDVGAGIHRGHRLSVGPSVEQGFAVQATIVQRRDFSFVSSSSFYFIPLTLRIDAAWPSLVKSDPTLPGFFTRKLKLPRWFVIVNYSCYTFTNNNNKQFVVPECFKY